MLKNNKPSEHIQTLNINGLQGRMLTLKAKKKTNKEILFVYGHHSSLERWWGMVQVMSRYGNVTMPDLPGFGGMDSLYKIGKKPTIDNMADYLATFVKLRYKRKKVKIAGLSFGFVVATRMLQLHPELVSKVELLVSVAGFAHKDDFSFSKPRYQLYLNVSRLFKRRLPAIFFKNVFLNPTLIKLIYSRTHNAKHKFKGLHHDSFKAMMEFEIYLWHLNDVRTHWYTSQQMLQLDNCGIKIATPLHHVVAKKDQYFDSYNTEQHLNIIFPEVIVHKATLDKHAPSLIADEQQAAHLFPDSFVKVLNS